MIPPHQAKTNSKAIRLQKYDAAKSSTPCFSVG